MVARFRALVLVLLVASFFTPLSTSSGSAQSTSCADYDAWTWAQTVFDSDPAAHAALDPDGNGIACDELTVYGFGPVLWTNAIPATAVPAQVSDITDGDTLKVVIDGAEDTVRLYHINAPETSNLGGGLQCGGHESTAFLTYVLGFAPGGTVYLEYDQTERDRFDRRLAYVWFQIGDDVYMVNEVMVRHGWAESDTYPPDDKYKEQLDAAQQFSVQKVLGVRLICGKFGQPVGSAPSGQQLREAQQRQPNQGQFDGIVSREAREAQATEAAAPPTAVPLGPPPMTDLAPTAPPAPQPPPGDCDPSYPGVCIPPAWQVGDLDCGDIQFRRFQVVPPDPHNFDGDFDGIGCEGG